MALTHRNVLHVFERPIINWIDRAVIKTMQRLDYAIICRLLATRLLRFTESSRYLFI
jgi:hypothetical protein